MTLDDLELLLRERTAHLEEPAGLRERALSAAGTTRYAGMTSLAALGSAIPMGSGTGASEPAARCLEAALEADDPGNWRVDVAAPRSRLPMACLIFCDTAKPKVVECVNVRYCEVNVAETISEPLPRHTTTSPPRVRVIMCSAAEARRFQRGRSYTGDEVDAWRTMDRREPLPMVDLPAAALHAFDAAMAAAAASADCEGSS